MGDREVRRRAEGKEDKGDEQEWVERIAIQMEIHLAFLAELGGVRREGGGEAWECKGVKGGEVRWVVGRMWKGVVGWWDGY